MKITIPFQTITRGRTVYKVRDTSTLVSDHAKCTGKHRKVNSKGGMSRVYPNGYSMSTRDYVELYQSLNHKLHLINNYDLNNLTNHITRPEGQDLFEVAP
jgi:hypothetical protein